jgi:type II secretory pathway component PulF
MAEEFPGGRAQSVLRRLADRIDAGLSLDAALAAEGPRVPEHLRCLLEAAVRNGRFAEVIDEMVALERTRIEVRHRLGIAFAYPLFLCMVILLIYLMSMYIVPQFGTIYRDFGAALPVLTQVMLRVCSPLAVLSVLALVLLAVLVVLVAIGGRTRSPGMQRTLYRLPIVGPIWRFRGLAEFSRLMGLLLELNVPLPQALRAVAVGLREGDLRAAARSVAEQVESGVPFSEAMARRREFPTTFKPLVQWGEQTPALADAFRGTAQMCEGRLRFQGLFADAVLLPVMLAVVVFFVAVFMVSFMLPLISLIQRLS